MPIVSSQTIEDRDQGNGRKHMRFEFTDHLAEVHTRFRRGPVATDADALRLSLVPDVENALKRREKNEIYGLESRMVAAVAAATHGTPRHVERWIARQILRSEDTEDVIRCEELLNHWFDTYSNAELRTRLDFGPPQLSSLRTKKRQVLEDDQAGRTAKGVRDYVRANLVVEEIEDSD